MAKSFFITLFLLSTTWAQSQQLAPPANFEGQKIFEEFWQTAKPNIYPLKLEQKYFTPRQYEKMKRRAADAKNLDELATQINAFLSTLKVSHTQFYTESDLEFFFFRSLFGTRDPKTPAIAHIGAEYKKSVDGFQVRSVLNGYPAEKADLKRGDLILKANGSPFVPAKSFQGLANKTVELEIKRRSKVHKIKVTPLQEGLHQSYISATKNSVREIKKEDKTFGYVHLWTGTHDETKKELAKAVKSLKHVDGFILDLRDGFGGAWYDHLDPFFEDSSTYFESAFILRDGTKNKSKPESKTNPESFKKPMVVIINEGVRSGKEALAFQFKKTKRATLIGTRTAGFFVAGAAHMRELSLPYFLYLSSQGLLLDGVDLEGKGVEPDVNVDWPLQAGASEDPQLKRAEKVLLNKLKQANRL